MSHLSKVETRWGDLASPLSVCDANQTAKTVTASEVGVGGAGCRQYTKMGVI